MMKNVSDDGNKNRVFLLLFIFMKNSVLRPKHAIFHQDDQMRL
jgi:hypothetical protein